MGVKKSTLKDGEKLPSLLKNDNTTNSRMKLKPLADKLGQSKLL